MKIADIKTMNFRGYVIMRVETDEGIYGLGEGRCSKEQVMSLEKLIVGQDPTDKP